MRDDLKSTLDSGECAGGMGEEIAGRGMSRAESQVAELRGKRVVLMAGTLAQGGAERQLFYIAQALKEAGAEPYVLCLTHGEFWEGRIRQLGVRVIWVGQIGSRLWRIARIMNVAFRIRPAVVQSQHFYVNVYTGLVGRLIGAPMVGAVRNDGAWEKRCHGRLTWKILVGLPKLLACNSVRALRNLREMGVSARRLFYLPNAIDASYFKRARGRERGNTFTVVGVGRLARQKRIDRWLRVVAAVRDRADCPVRGIIAGDGPLRDELARQASALGLLPGCVEFWGAVSDVRRVYEEGDLLLLTSDWEGTPNVVLEAMASGLPVVGTDVGDVPYLVRDGETGYVVELTNEEGLVNGVLRLIADGPGRQSMGTRAREVVKARYDVRLLPERLAQLYTRLWGLA